MLTKQNKSLLIIMLLVFLVSCQATDEGIKTENQQKIGTEVSGKKIKAVGGVADSFGETTEESISSGIKF